jgi:ketosteroid isomerase-like protein
VTTLSLYGRCVTQANLDLIDRFYAAFARHDGDAMAACYTADATFTDPVFTDLSGKEPGAMWRMLTARSTDLQVELEERAAAGDSGSAHWIAHYTFGQTGRPVVNDVHSTFRFRDGLIAEQRDDFDLYGWTRQALGPIGVALGWTPIVQGGVRRKARAGLDQFLAREG